MLHVLDRLQNSHQAQSVRAVRVSQVARSENKVRLDFLYQLLNDFNVRLC